MLAAALQRLDTCDNRSKRVYAIEFSKHQRKYVITSPDEVWDSIAKSKRSHFYEVLSEPCNLYLDIEWYSQAPLSPDNESQRVKTVVDHVCSQLHSLYDEQNPIVSKVSASGQSSKGYKSSWHVHINCSKVCWLNSAAVGSFVRQTCSEFDEVDKSPYAGTGQNWRCVGSSKFTEPARRFLPADRDTFLQCTVQHPVNGRQVIYPDVPVLQAIPCQSWVKVLADTLQAGNEPIMVSADRCVVPFKKRQMCEHVNRVHRSNHQYAIINLRTLMWKMGCHACPHAISCWRVFPSDVLQAAFAAQSSNYTGTAHLPAMKVEHHVAAHHDLRAHGPPPYRGGQSVQCRDGVYVFSPALQ